MESEKELFDHAIRTLSKAMVEPGSLVSVPEAVPSALLQDLINEYLEDASDNIKDSKTLKGFKSQLHTFLETLGNVPVHQVTRKIARKAVSGLKKLLPNRKKLAAYRDLSIATIIDQLCVRPGRASANADWDFDSGINGDV